MKNRVSVKFFAKNTANDDLKAVYLRVVMQRKKVESKICVVKAGNWNEESQKVGKKEPDSFKLNLLIETKAKLVKDFVFVAELENRQLSIVDIANLIKSEPVPDRIDLYEFLQKEVENLRTTTSYEHYRHFRASVSKLRKWRPVAFVHDLDSDFIESYVKYMKVELKNHNNTVAKNLIFIRKFCQIAVEKRLLKTNPLKDIKLKREKSNIQALTMKSVDDLEALLLSENINVKIKKVVRWFLFSCYTGLRYSDLKNLKHENIVENMIEIRQQKTVTRVRIPLSERARKHLPAPARGFVFDLYVNQKCNEYLKLAAAAINYPGNLTFHMSRHTFATLSLNFMIPLDVVSELMGHSDRKTTKIYAEYIDKTLTEEMKKWE